MDNQTKKLIWNFGALLWINEYGENPGEFENPNKTNMVELFNDYIKSINKPVETTNERPYKHDDRNLWSDDM